MPRKRLTELMLEKIKLAPGSQTDIFDATFPGLMVRISQGAGRKEPTRTFRAIYYEKIGGATRARSIKLGRFPTMTLKMAKERARAILADPQAARRNTETGSVQQISDEFIKRYVQKRGLHSEKEIVRILKRDVLPKWGHRLITDLRRSDVTALLDFIEDDAGPRQADMVLSIVGKMFRWHQARTDDWVPPLAPGMRRTSTTERKRKRVLSDDEIRAVWAATEDMEVFGGLVRLLLLTTQRERKVGHMRRDAVEDGAWEVPHEKGQKGVGGLLKLPQMALDIIEAQPRIAGNPFVFPGGRRRRDTKPSRAAKQPAFNSYGQRMSELRDKLPNDMPHWTLHDLRRTGRTLMSRAGVSSEIAERTLGHVIEGVEGVYDRFAYVEEKADALRKLAALVERIIHPPANNVVPITSRAKKRPQRVLLAKRA